MTAPLRSRSGVVIAGLLAGALALALGLSRAVARPSSGPPPVERSPRASGERLNVLFILSDDQRWDTLGAAGNAVVRTPHLDRLAAEGTLFRNSFCTTSICSVSRASLLSGQWARRHGVEDFATPLPEASWAQSYPPLLRAAGYTTGFVGKWGVGAPLPTSDFDFWAGYDGQGDYFSPGESEHLTVRLGRQAKEFVLAAREPFSLSVSFKAPHAQDGAPRLFPPDPADEALYEGVAIPMPPSATEAAFSVLPPFLRLSEGRTRFLSRFASPELSTATVRDYYRLVTGMDREIGGLLDALEARGLAERTLVVFTSDNGLLLGDHGLADKWLMYEESIRTPLVVRAPALPEALRGRVVSEMALNVDVAPTLLDAAGLPVPETMQGTSLLPFVLGARDRGRDDFFYEHHYTSGGTIPESEGVRTRRWKYVRYVGEDPLYEQLFDLRYDPNELQDLLHAPRLVGEDASLTPADHRRIRDALRARWKELREALR